MIIAQYFVEFIFYSFLGWIWESIYCSAKEHKWADRGFLFGPVCPIYGSAVVLTSVIFGGISALSSPDFPIWGIFIICYIGSAVLEFGTSWVLEKRFHARWWDYSYMPLNIQGRICVPVSTAFGIVGVFVVRYLIPTIEGMHEVIPTIIYEVLAIILAMAFGADYALTEASLSALLKNVEEMHREFNEHAQTNYEKLAGTPRLIKGKLREEKDLMELRYEAFTKAYAERMSFNQRRLLLAIHSFTSRRGDSIDTIDLKNRLSEHLKVRVRGLRKKHDRKDNK